MLHTLRLTLPVLVAATALAACSSAPSNEPVGGQADELSRCMINHDCPDPSGDPPPHSPPPPPPSCRTSHPSCTLDMHADTDWREPALKAAGCTWEATYYPNDPALKEWIYVAYCASGPAWDNFVWPPELVVDKQYNHVGVNVCDHCLPPPAPGYFYFFFYVGLGPNCQGGCPGNVPFT